MEEIEKLKILFYDPKTGYTGLKKLQEKAKENNIKLTGKQIKEWYNEQEITQTNKPQRKVKLLKITAPPYSYQIDVIYINQSVYFIMIEITSRKLFIEHLKRNINENILSYLNEYVKTNKIKRLEGDLQFNTQNFKKFCDDNRITYDFQSAKDDHITKGNRLGIVDRVVRTIKNLIRKSKIKSIEGIKNIVENYNDTYHTTTKQKPNELHDNPARMLDIHSFISKENDIKENINIGSTVRIKQNKNKFDKEKQTYSNETYEITGKQGNKYRLDNTTRLYKPNEILIVKPNAMKRPEKIKETKEPEQAKHKQEKHIEDSNIINEKRIRKKINKMDL
jgi:hypothetical protein